MAIFAEWLMETKRIERGLKEDDTSQDEEIIKEMQSGEKLSKSKHLGYLENKNE